MPTDWIIHTKDGKSITDQYPHDVDESDITSVERVLDGRVFSIKKAKCFSNFFVKTEAGQAISVMGGGVSPPEILKKILGCHIETSVGTFRLELEIEPDGHVRLSAIPVDKVSPDGF